MRTHTDHRLVRARFNMERSYIHHKKEDSTEGEPGKSKQPNHKKQIPDKCIDEDYGLRRQLEGGQNRDCKRKMGHDSECQPQGSGGRTRKDKLHREHNPIV